MKLCSTLTFSHFPWTEEIFLAIDLVISHSASPSLFFFVLTFTANSFKSNCRLQGAGFNAQQLAIVAVSICLPTGRIIFDCGLVVLVTVVSSWHVFWPNIWKFQGLYEWRDVIARAEDESTGYVLPNKELLEIGMFKKFSSYVLVLIGCRCSKHSTLLQKLSRCLLPQAN